MFKAGVQEYTAGMLVVSIVISLLLQSPTPFIGYLISAINNKPLG